jgi:hypothetical protein
MVLDSINWLIRCLEIYLFYFLGIMGSSYLGQQLKKMKKLLIEDTYTVGHPDNEKRSSDS